MCVIIVVIILAGAAAEYRDPYVTIPEEVEVKTGETASIHVIVEHVQTTMWNVKVYVDTDQVDPRFLSRLNISADQENPVLFEGETSHGTEISATIDVAVAANSPEGQVKIPIIVAGDKGPCLKGCEPFLVQKSTTLKIQRQDPKLALLIPESTFEVYQGEIVTAVLQLKNYGALTAYVEKLEAVLDEPLTYTLPTAPGQVEPGVTESAQLIISTKDAAPGSYLVQVKLVYKDEIQNKFTDSKTMYITVLEKEPLPSTTPPVISTPPHNPVQPDDNVQYQYFVAGMFTGAALFGVAIMIGIFLKKRRPTK